MEPKIVGMRKRGQDFSLHCWDCDVSGVEGMTEMKVGGDGGISQLPLCPKCLEARGIVAKEAPTEPPPKRPTSLGQMTVTADTSRKLKEMGYPETVLSWYEVPGPVGCKDVMITAKALEGLDYGVQFLLIGPAPTAEELIQDLPPGDMAWKSKAGYFCSNRGRGRVGYANLAEALAYAWIDRRVFPDDDGKKRKRSYSY